MNGRSTGRSACSARRRLHLVASRQFCVYTLCLEKRTATNNMT